MSWSNDSDPQAAYAAHDDFELEGEDPELEEGADNPEDEAVEARARELAQQIAQEQIDQFRGQYGRRFNTFKTRAVEDLGLDVADDGTPVIRDPQKFVQYAQQLGQQQQPAAQTQATEEIPDQYGDPQGYQRWLQAQINAEVERRIAPLQQANQQLGFGAVVDRAVPVLEAYNLGPMAETPEFRQAFRNALNTVSVDQWHDDLVVEMAVGAAIPVARRALGADWQPGQTAQTQGRQDPQALMRQAARAGLSQTGTSRGGRSDQPQYSADVIEAAKLANMPPDEFLIFSDPSGKAGYDYLAKQERTAARRTR